MMWTRLLVSSFFAVGIACYAYGCGTSHPTLGGGGPNLNPNNQGGPCAPNGATQTCDVPTGTINGVVNCFQGTQTCQNGSWSVCGGSGSVSGHSEKLSTHAAAHSGLRITDYGPATDAGVCTGNVCDPYCWGFDDDGGFVDEAGAAPGCYVQIDPGTAYNQLDNSWQLNPGGCTSGAADNCEYGSHCSAGVCIFNYPGYSNAADAAGQPDYTIDIPCCGSGRNDGDCNGDDPPEFMLCNVGLGPGSGTVWVSAAPSPGIPAACGQQAGASFYCSVNLGAGLSPGQCMNWQMGAGNCTSGWTTNGQWGLLANDPMSGARAAESNTCNNYTVYEDDNSIGCGVNVSCSSPTYPSGNFGGLPGPKKQASANPCTDNRYCSYDQCCSAAGGVCNPWATGPCMAACAGVDFTVETGCNNGAGERVFTVCNRGTLPTAGGTLVLGLGGSGNPPSPLSCSPPGLSASSGCNIDLAVNTLAPGQCVVVDVDNPGPGITCSCGGGCGSGNKYVYVNDTAAIAECDTCNNWSFAGPGSGQCSGGAGAGPVPAPVTQTFPFVATCPMGTHPVWNQFIYNVTVPVASEVSFAVQTAATYIDGGMGPWVPASPILIADPPLPDPGNALLTDPANCLLSGPAPCPINLGTYLSNAAMSSGDPTIPTNANLLLTITLMPISASPSADYWSFSYDCVPSE